MRSVYPHGIKQYICMYLDFYIHDHICIFRHMHTGASKGPIDVLGARGLVNRYDGTALSDSWHCLTR